MNEQQRQEVIKDIAESVNDKDTCILIAFALTKNGDLSRRGFINGANSVDVLACLSGLLEAAADMAGKAKGPYEAMIPTLNNLKEAAIMGAMLGNVIKQKREQEKEAPDDMNFNDEQGKPPHDFNFDIPGDRE